MSTDDIYIIVQNITGKDNSGYMDNDEFNNYLRLSSNALFEYYYKMFEKTRSIHNALRPFIVNKNISVSNGVAPLPSDYRNVISARGILNVGGVKTYHEAHDLKHHEDIYIVTSPIRKPKRGLYAYRIAGEQIQWRPEDYTGKIRFEYFKNPQYGERVTTINIDTDQEEYDDTNSIDSEWPETELNNLVDIIIGFKGIQIRESELLTWLKEKNLSIKSI